MKHYARGGPLPAARTNDHAFAGDDHALWLSQRPNHHSQYGPTKSRRGTLAGILTKNTQSYCIKAMLAFVGWIVLDAQPLVAYSVLTTNRDMAISVSNTTLLGSAVSVKPSP